MLQWLKNILKRFLPPPVKSFNREIERVLSRLDAVQAETGSNFSMQMLELEAQKKELERLARSLTQQGEVLAQHGEALAQQREALAQQREALAQQRETLAQQGEALAQQGETLVQQKENLTRLDLELTRQKQDAFNYYSRNTPQPRLSYFVLNILDHCNLRCKGCDHFAAIAEKRFVAIEEIRQDLEQMAKLTERRVTRIGVMGGEPLLHPQLREILAETRRFFPSTLIQLVSNGILLLRQPNEFWEVCRDHHIMIVVTKYPLNLKFQEMQYTAERWGVAFRFYGNTGEAMKTSYKNPMDPSGMQNPSKSFLACYHGNQLPLLMEGKFYPCTVMPNTRHFNKKFGTKMEMEQGDYLDIYGIQNMEELLHFLSTPKPFCRYCKTHERSYGHPWERSKQVAEEWL